MMAAGLPVVELYRNNTLYDLPIGGCLLCDQTPESLAEGIIQILNNESQRMAMSQAARAFMADKDIQLSLNQFVDAIKIIESGGQVVMNEQSLPVPIYTDAPVVAGPFVNTVPKDLGRIVRRRKSDLPTALRWLRWFFVRTTRAVKAFAAAYA
jgi:hypothetical protein